MKLQKAVIIFAVILSLLVSGCINIEVYQKLKRNGNYDLDLTISTSAEYKMILNSFKQAYQVEDSVKDKFEYSETDTSITYSFKDLNPKTDVKLFKDVEQDASSQSMFGGTSDAPDSSLFDPESFEYSRQLKFPYYEYSFQVTMNPEPEVEEVKELSADKYIIDEANLLDEASKQEILAAANRIFADDNVELIVVTKQQLDSYEFLSFKYDFTSDFEFQGEGEQYVLVLVTLAPTKRCDVSSNIFLDTDTYQRISEMSTEIGPACTQDPKSAITSAVAELDAYFREHDLEQQSQLADQLGSMFKIGYTVEVFGSVVETTGMKMGDNKVKFDINPSGEGEYTLVFRDFFLASLLGDHYWLYLILLVVLVVGLVGLKVLKNKKTMPHTGGFEPEPTLKAPVAVNPHVLDYVHKARAYGMNDGQIKTALLHNGWSEHEIEVALQH